MNKGFEMDSKDLNTPETPQDSKETLSVKEIEDLLKEYTRKLETLSREYKINKKEKRSIDESKMFFSVLTGILTGLLVSLVIIGVLC